jgi:NADH-quinone oxidoreductase subunit F
MRTAPPLLAPQPHPAETLVLTKNMRLPNSASIETYLSQGGYQEFLKATKMSQDDIINEVKTSNLRGRGGAGFPTGMKWGFVPRQSPKPKYIVVNGDESEPGTCKDRVLMQYDPHQFIEGILIASLAVGAHHGWIYIRGEYRYAIDVMDKAIAEAYAKGWLGKNIQGTGVDFELSTHSGAGAYECGEESALLESLEGKRGNPRIRPPFPAVSGAFQCPTILNNVETFFAVPSIIRMGGQAWADLGIPKAGGTKLTCLTGHVNKPGVYELKLGFPVKKMLEDVGGGIRMGRKMKAFIPGGSSCPVLTGDEAWELTMDYDNMAKAGTMLGSGGVVIMDDQTDMVNAALRIMRFYQHESCGWCIPCREGTLWLKKLLTRLDEGVGTGKDIDLVGNLAENMLGRTFCPLGDAAALPTISIVKKFRHEFEAKIKKSVFSLAGADPLIQVGQKSAGAH